MGELIPPAEPGLIPCIGASRPRAGPRRGRGAISGRAASVLVGRAAEALGGAAAGFVVDARGAFGATGSRWPAGWRRRRQRSGDQFGQPLDRDLLVAAERAI